MKKFADMNEQGGLWVMTDLSVESLNDLAVIWGSSEQTERKRRNRYCVPLIYPPRLAATQLASSYASPCRARSGLELPHNTACRAHLTN